MKTTLLLSTYNSPKYLTLCLKALQRQTLMPDEIVIADDGSKDETRELIESFRSSFSCPIVHVWHEDKGFRLAMILNKALAQCSGDYIIHIDGDIITERHFIEDHVRFAKPGYFMAGSRCLLTEETTKRILEEETIDFNIFSKGVEHRFNMVRMPWLAPLCYGQKSHRGCNIAYWRKDVYAINGYDQRMIENGYDDTDLVERLLRNGVRQRHLKLAAVAFHIWHKTRTISTTNGAFYDENRLKGTTRLEEGISNYLNTEP